MSYKRFLKTVPAFFLCGTLILSGCGKSNSTNTSTETSAKKTSTLSYQVSKMNLASMFTSRDLEQEADTTDAVYVTLADNSSKESKVNRAGDKSGVSIKDNTVTISKEGVYVLSGSLTNGQIVVDCDDTSKVQIVLDGVTISNETLAGIYVKSADKTFVTTTKGSENTIETTGAFTADGDTNVDGAIFSKDDLTINGQGTLSVKSSAHGIVSKDDLKVTGGKLNVDATSHALRGKDSIRVANGTFTLTAGKDALHSGNADDKTKGYIYIEDGKFTINAEDDGIHADTDLYILDGKITIKKSYEGLEGNTITIKDGTIDITASDDGMNAAAASDDTEEENSGDFKNGPKMDDPNASDDTAVLYIDGGKINVNASGDGLDSNGSLTVTGGTVYVDGPSNDGNGALDVGTKATITGGKFIATGGSGMAVNFGSDSTQGSMLVGLDDNTTDTIYLLDSSGKTIMEYTPTKNCNSVVFSSSKIKKDQTYTVKRGSNTYEVKMDSLQYSSIKNNMEAPSGNTPEKPSGTPANGSNGEKPSGKPDKKPDQKNSSGSNNSTNSDATSGDGNN